MTSVLYGRDAEAHAVLALLNGARPATEAVLTRAM
jgi:hypothetical protein